MPVVQVTLHLPDELWRAVQALAPEEGDTNTVILRALEDYVTAPRKRRGRPRPGQYQTLVTALSLPVPTLNLSARPATALPSMNIRYVYALVALEPRALRVRRNFGEKSLREVQAKLAALGLSLSMTLDHKSYPAAVVATVAAHIKGTRGCAGCVPNQSDDA